MSYVAVTFPASGTNKSAESLAKAKKFAKKVGLEESDVSSIRAGVYGCILPSDVSSIVLNEVAKHGGKVLPFVESKSVVEEGKWVTVKKAVAGTRFEMSGTTAIGQADGRIMPDKFYVLGIQESDGGVFATLGRVDKLFEIGRKNGPGRYIYNVPLDLLRESLQEEVELPEEVKSTDVASSGTQSQTNESDRSLEILDMLLENDQFLAREQRNAKMLKQKESESDKVLVETEDSLLNSLVEESINNPTKVDYSDEELANYKPLAEVDISSAVDDLNDGSELLGSLLGSFNENHDDQDTLAENTGVNLDKAPMDEPEEVDEPTDGDQDAATDLGEEEELDPEVYESARGIIDAMVEAGIDIDSMDDDQLEEAVNEFMSYLESLGDDGDDDTDREEVVEDDEQPTSDEDVSEDKTGADDSGDGDDENKQESTGSGDFQDSGFEASPGDVPEIREVGDND